MSYATARGVVGKVKMSELRIIITGSRNFTDYNLLCKAMNQLNSIINTADKVEIVSGASRGADQLGEKYAAEHGYEIKRFPADWEAYGKSAGHIRNREMVKYAIEENGYLVAFWDGKSNDIKGIIDYATQIGMPMLLY